MKYAKASDEYYTLRYWHQKAEWGYMRILGVPVALKAYPDWELFASRGWRGDKPLPRVGKDWGVYDALTGSLITSDIHDTPQAAVDSLERAITENRGRFVYDEWQERQERWIADNGLSPRYARSADE